jgi:uncharacterized OB-fold protein
VPSPRPITSGLFITADEGPRLLGARCAACARLQFPATSSCPYCGHDACREETLGPHATLFLFTTIASRPPGYRGPLPYGFGVVELAEGLRVVTRLADADQSGWRVGLPMRLVVAPLFDDEDGTPVLSYAFAREDA